MVPLVTTPSSAGRAALSPAAGLDLKALKEKQRTTWASGDFSVVAARIVFVAEQLCETVDVQAGWRVLDVATGSGNAAIAAARRGCVSVGTDFVPALLQAGRERVKSERVDAAFVEGDAESLPFPNSSFDAVLSVYGSMFAPDHLKTARELARVCKRGGRIGLASWTPNGFIGDMFRLIGRYVPPNPGLLPPVLWGDESHLKAIFGETIRSITSQVRTAIFRFPTAEFNVEFFRTYYGPTLKTFQSLTAAQQEALAKDMADLARSYDRNGGGPGPIAIAADYLETVIVRA